MTGTNCGFERPRVSFSGKTRGLIAIELLVALLASPHLPAAEPPITAVAFSPDGKHVAAVSQAGLTIHQWPELKRQSHVGLSFPNPHAIAFSIDGTRLAVAGGWPSEQGGVSVFAFPSGDRLLQLSTHTDSVRAMLWLGGDQLLTASLDRTINLHRLTSQDIESGPSTVVRSFLGHSRSVDALAWVVGDTMFASAGADQSVRVWNVKDGKLIRSLRQHAQPVHALANRPGADGLPLVASAAGDRTVRFWQPTIGRMVRFARLSALPLSLTWSRNGDRVFVACDDGHVHVVDPTSVTVVDRLPAIEGWAYTLAIHPTRDELVVGGEASTLVRIDLARPPDGP